MKAVFLDFDTLGPDELDIAGLQSVLPGIELYAATPVDKIAERIRAANIVIVNKTPLSGELLAQASDLQLVCLAATGSDNVDLVSAREYGIKVCNIRDYCTPSVVQHVFALILELTQRLTSYRGLIDRGAWQLSEQFCMLDFSGRELQGKTLGVVGTGTLGRAVANVAAAFGMQVVAAQLPHRQPADGELIPRLEWRAFLQSCDVISLHCPLTVSTEKLIDKEALELIRYDALLINTARGGLIDSAALLSCLDAGELGGAGIDVLPEEPPVNDDPLLSKRLPNLIVTPHIAWAAKESRQRALDEIVENVRAFQAGSERNLL